MNGLLIFLTALIVAVVLGRQHARHDLSLRIRCRRAAMPLPPELPRLRMLEALLVTALGVTFLLAGGVMIITAIDRPVQFAEALLQNGIALSLAVGAGLCGFGGRAIVLLLRGRGSTPS